LKETLDQGLEPVIADMTAYFPGVPQGIAINTEKISSAADVAVVKGNVSAPRIKPIALADGRRAAVSGSPVVLLGYPTALDAILARAGAETLRSIATASKASLHISRHCSSRFRALGCHIFGPADVLIDVSHGGRGLWWVLRNY
jgi:hypothetical protein